MLRPQQIVVRLWPGSDGDATHVPPLVPQGYTQLDPPVLYLEKLGQQWMESRGEARAGVSYALEKLPHGYTVWQRPRQSNPKHLDKYIYGHPYGAKFDSANRFFPHFEHLMKNNGDNMGCPCTLCAGHAGVLPSRSSSSSTRTQNTKAPSRIVSKPAPASSAIAPPSKRRPKTMSVGKDTSHVDEEDTPDVYRNLIDKLRRDGTLDQAIQEPLSPDWCAEQESLSELLSAIEDQQQWIPRAGDIILYVRDLPEHLEIVRHKTTRTFQLHNKLLNQYRGSPQWEAGLVGQTPTELPAANSVQGQDQEMSIIYSGVRVEPVAGPNTSDKSIPKRYKYVTLRQIRPFVLWFEFLHHIPPDEWHPSIANALTMTSTLSLMGKYRFRGSWPNAVIYCHGIFIGSELIVVGDTVRLLPTVKSEQTTCTDIMVVKSIRLKWSGLDSMFSDNEDNEGLYTSEIWVYGSAYTNEASRSDKQWLSDENTEAPRAADGYGNWYPLHPSTKELAVPFYRLLGRLYERDAMAFFLYTDPEEQPDLDSGQEGLVEARNYSRQHDRRIVQKPHANWYWADNRADALDLHTINGVDVAKYDQERNIKDLRKNVKILHALTENTATAPSSGFRGIDLRSFEAPEMSSLPVGTQSVQEPSARSSKSERSNPSKKKAKVIDLSDSEDEEIRQSMKIIQDEGITPLDKKKQAKVSVIID